jgi:hypothetical protein
MSLINEALKKAQRLRNEEQAAAAETMLGGSGGRIAKRGQARSANTMVLIGAGAIVLVVLSVVVTVYLINRPSPKPAAPVATTPATKSPSETPAAKAPETLPPVVDLKIAPAPAPSAPAPATAASSTNSAPAPASVANAPAPRTESAPAASTGPGSNLNAPSTTAATGTGRAPASTAAPLAFGTAASASTATPGVAEPESTASTPATPPRQDERIMAFIDTIRVTATRAAEGRVLMNERVYRVNDIVERNLGLRLTKVAIDSLTFTDANGAVYVKYF